MNDIKRFFTVIVLILIVVGGYYYSDEIKSATANLTKGKLPEIKSNESNKNNPSDNNQNIKQVIVEEEDAVTMVVEKSSPAVVSIVQKNVVYDMFDGPSREENSIGTGFIIDGKNWIVLTNKHVVSDKGSTFSIILNNQDTYNVEKVYIDPANDFAILKIDQTGHQGKELPQLNLGDSDKIKVGQTVIAIGNSLGEFGNSVTKGVISGLKRGIVAGGFRGGENLENVIQTDAALNPGNSGGPLLNLSGDVIGINVAITQGAQNVGFALPINNLKTVIDTFQKEGKISRPYLGVEYMQITKDVSEKRALPVGAFVRDIVDGSPAEKAGIKIGDIILKVDGVRLNDTDKTLSKVVSAIPIGKDIEILLDRNGRETTVKLKLVDLAGQ